MTLMKTVGIFILLFTFISRYNAVAENLDLEALKATATSAIFRERPRLTDLFIVSRRGENQKKTCVARKDAPGLRNLLLGYDLDKLRIPSGGFTWNWTQEWQMTNLASQVHIKAPYKTLSRGFIFTDGGSKFLPHVLSDRPTILAENASLWYVPGHFSQEDERWGLLVQIDHLDAATGVKYTKAMRCPIMLQDFKQDEFKNCTTVDSKNNTNLLRRGRDLARFSSRLELVENGSVIIYFSTQEFNAPSEIVLKWILPDKKIDNFYNGEFFVRTHQKPGVFYESFDITLHPTKKDNQMSRNFSHPKSGNFCVLIESKIEFAFQHELLSIDQTRPPTRHKGRTEWHKYEEFDRRMEIDFGVLQAGNFQLTLANINQSALFFVELCPGSTKFAKETMTHPPFPTPDFCILNGRQVDDDFDHRARDLFSHSYPNATLETNWDANDWAYVCARLGIWDNQTDHVVIKFCNPYYGCNFSKCPHPEEREPKQLFEPDEPSKNGGSQNFLVYTIIGIIAVLLIVSCSMIVVKYCKIVQVFYQFI